MSEHYKSRSPPRTSLPWNAFALRCGTRRSRSLQQSACSTTQTTLDGSAEGPQDNPTLLHETPPDGKRGGNTSFLLHKESQQTGALIQPVALLSSQAAQEATGNVQAPGAPLKGPVHMNMERYAERTASMRYGVSPRLPSQRATLLA